MRNISITWSYGIELRYKTIHAFEIRDLHKIELVPSYHKSKTDRQREASNLLFESFPSRNIQEGITRGGDGKKERPATGSERSWKVAG